MKRHAFVQGRVPALLVLALFVPATILGPVARVNAQAPPLPQMDITSGLSLHNSFYDELAQDLSADLGGRTGTYSGTEFYPHLALAQAEVEQFNDDLQSSFDDAIEALEADYPDIVQVILDIILFFVNLFCGGTTPGAEVILPQERVFGICTLANNPIHWSQLSNGHEVLIDAARVGVISQIEIAAWIGDRNGTCSKVETEDLRFYFKNLQYRGVITFTPAGADVTVSLVGTLPSVTTALDSSEGSLTAAGLYSHANAPIGGQTLQQRMATFATTVVPESLKIALERYWGAYLAHDPAANLANWQMDLGGGKQSQRFGANAVTGSVGAADYQQMISDMPNSKSRVVYKNTHSTIFPDPEDGVCADGTALAAAAAIMTPNTFVEGPTAEGSFHTSFKNFEHAVIGGIRAAVGLRADYKLGSPYIINHSFASLVPEAGASTLSFLLTNTSSPLRDPQNPVVTVPISSTQRSALLATPVAGTGTLGNTPLSDLRLKIAICEERKTVLPNPLSATSSDGVVSHEVLMEATIVRNNVAILTERFDATFDGRLRITKALNANTIELRTIHCFLTSLRTFYPSSFDWTEITASTSFSSAPVSLMLRALFGDHLTPAGSADQRAFYLIEGLTGGLIERSAHGIVALPGLDIPAYTGPKLAHDILADEFYEDDYELGFVFDRPELCASITRWGQAPGLVNGVPNGLPRNRTLVIELDWSEKVPLTTMERKNMRTGVTVGLGTSADPFALVNPSRYDGGGLCVDYVPVLGDESRVVDMSGNRFGAFIPNGGSHWVAATPIGYGALREMVVADPVTFGDVSVELRPYRALGTASVPCDLIFPVGPVAASDGAPGAHHEALVTDIYEALLFETQLSCRGPGDCDGTRVVARWTAPLFADCGPLPAAGNFALDRFNFALAEGTLRVPPTSYQFQIQPGCMGQGGGGGLGGGRIDD
ncbi:MAG: hypothetical protein ACKVXR_08565 [Planctomycetota bacterium]